MSTEKLCHFAHLLQVSKKYLWSLILYIIFHVFIHVYSPGAGADNPLGSEFLFSHKPFVTGHLLYVSSIKWLSNSFSPYKSIRDQIWPCCKIGQGQSRVIIGTNYVGPRVPNVTYQATRSLALWFWRRRFLKGFYHIWAWQPSWSCDPDPINKLSFPHPTEALYEIWLWLAQQF